MTYKYLVEFRVAGTRDFPLDMLRYDQCWPRNSDDSISIHQTFEKQPPPETPIQICMIKHCEFKDRPNVTTGRWASFGWHVVADTITVRKLVS